MYLSHSNHFKNGVSLYVIIILIFIIGCSKQKDNSPKEVVVCSYGGSYQEAERKAFFEPFEKETGIKVREAEWSGEYSKLKAMVESGTIVWDLVTVAEGSTIARGISEGVFEPIDYKILDRNKYFVDAVTDYSVGIDFYSTVLGYNSKDYAPGVKHPSSWADFWDTKNYPGARSLRNDPRTTLEFALLADGVSMDKIYPLDIDRAFNSLDRIKGSVKVWWTSGHQPAQLLADREVKLVSAFNGRIWTAATKDSMPLNVDWNQGCLDLDSWVIVKGTKNYDAAMALIEFSSRPEVQIELTKYINYGPTNPEAYNHLSQSARTVLPTSPENRPKQFVFNGKWWAQNESKVVERWNQWLLKR